MLTEELFGMLPDDCQDIFDDSSRSYYAEKIDSWLGSGQIIVLIGQRRVGKSFVMKDFIARHEKESDANMIYID